MESTLTTIPEESLSDAIKLNAKSQMLSLLTEMLHNDKNTCDYIIITRTANSIEINSDVNGQFSSGNVS